ncbi:MAG: hypothetical protein K8R52_02515 [Bacteroidales bacterium]|nr:hypothetical protein [Bacteroidales bacterium]
MGISQLHAQSSELVPRHIRSNDVEIIDKAFLHGYTHNIVYENVEGRKIPTLTIQCTDGGVHKSEKELSPDRIHYSVWTRDLYWGFLGWAQAGDDKVLEMMRSSLELLILAKDRNQALGQSKVWPLDDKRFYIPQAYTTGLKSALDFYPWCSESQADFLLLAYNYWELSGDRKYIESIWEDIVYVTKTVELMDTDGNSLPDALWGSYDYMWIKTDSEEPLMCAKTSLAYKSVARLGKLLGKDDYADYLDKLAAKVKVTMNKPLDEGGLWKPEVEGGYYIQMRKITPGQEMIEDMFIPYNNLVPMWCGMTDSNQDEAIFTKLDTHFDSYYDLEYGPMYCSPAAKNEESVMDCSSVTWLAFLDVYLRGTKGDEGNRTRIYEMLMEHAEDAGGIAFPEGAGVYGYLTGGAGRSWDNGNFFHMLICGVYGLEKSREGISISAPNQLDNVPLTELQNFCWRDAVYNFQWKGEGSQIRNIAVDGKEIKPESGVYILSADSGVHEVDIILGN